MNIEISYMSGAGNLFTVLDNRDYKFRFETLSRLSVVLCNSEFKTEGFLVMDNSVEYDFQVLFFNPDGSSDMMCGNGGRCAIFFASELNFFDKKKSVVFLMANKSYKGEIHNDAISLHLPPPIDIQLNNELVITNQKIKYHYIDVGSKHIVINFDEIYPNSNFDKTEIDVFAQSVRNHKKFLPDGVNINLYKLNQPDNKIYLKTFENGVEAVTGACGTGAIATSFVGINIHDYINPVTVLPPSGIELTVKFNFLKNVLNSIILKGHAEILKKQIINVEL